MEYYKIAALMLNVVKMIKMKKLKQQRETMLIRGYSDFLRKKELMYKVFLPRSILKIMIKLKQLYHSTNLERCKHVSLLRNQSFKKE
jgi:hypothetical protein